MFPKTKKAQGMPMNVIIIAIIVIVVLIVLIAFFAGGFTGLWGKMKEIISGKVSAREKTAAIEECIQWCEEATALDQRGVSINLLPYCNNALIVDIGGKATKVKCGTDSGQANQALTDAETKKGISQGAYLGVECSEIAGRCA